GRRFRRLFRRRSAHGGRFDAAGGSRGGRWHDRSGQGGTGVVKWTALAAAARASYLPHFAETAPGPRSSRLNNRPVEQPGCELGEVEKCHDGMLQPIDRYASRRAERSPVILR